MASEVKTNKISPATSTTINVGDSGDTLALATDAVTGFNVGSDAAGDILYNDGTDYTRLAKPGTPADEVLTFATGATAPSWAAASSGGLLGLVKYTGDGTYTVGGTSNGTAGDEGNASVTKIVVEVQGAGGSGNREDSTDNNNSAGGGGGYAKKFLDVTNISTVTVTVGDGCPGQSNIAAGTAGGLSSFVKATGSGSFTDVIGNGGAGGSTSSLAPAEGGTASGGDINIQGGVGSYNIQGHPAGGSILGNAGVSMQGTALTNGRGYGAGGGSGRVATSGAGADGIILIWEYA